MFYFFFHLKTLIIRDENLLSPPQRIPNPEMKKKKKKRGVAIILKILYVYIYIYIYIYILEGYWDHKLVMYVYIGSRTQSKDEKSSEEE